MGQHYDFQERLMWSDGFMNDGIAKILRSRIPECTLVERAQEKDDRQGTDYWAKREKDLPDLSIDVKVRSHDFSLDGKDDLALETWSVVGEKVGWTRDTSKRTDFILWFWQDTGRFFIVSFPALCKVFTVLWKEWAEQYETDTQDSGTWKSQCVFVPRQIVLDALNRWCSGTATK